VVVLIDSCWLKAFRELEGHYSKNTTSICVITKNMSPLNGEYETKTSPINGEYEAFKGV